MKFKLAKTPILTTLTLILVSLFLNFSSLKSISAAPPPPGLRNETLKLTYAQQMSTSGSLAFDGVDDIAPTVNIPTLNEFTVEAWVKRTVDSGDYQSFLSDANSGYGQVMFTLFVDGGNGECGGNPNDQFAFYDGSAQCSGVTAQLNTWYHVAISRDASGTRRFFVDGVLRNTQNNSPAPSDSNGILTLGRAGSFNGEYFAGLVDEIRISSVARYTSDFPPPTAPLVADQNTVALYHLDEGSGQIITDASGNGRDGTLGTNTAGQSSDPTWSADTPVVGQAPIADNQSVVTDEDTTVPVTLTATDADGDPLIYSVTNSPTNGSLSGSPPDLTYTPNQNYSGSDSFTFTANDGTLTSNEATISITINPLNDAPTAVDDPASTDQDEPVIINVLINDNDPDGDSLSLSSVTQAGNGSVINNGDGTVTYSPNPAYFGPDTFTYDVTDGLETDTGTVSVTVNRVNNPPSAGDDVTITDEDTPVVINVLTNDTDPDGDLLTVVSVTPAQNGLVNLNVDSSITYTPAVNFNGVDAFSYTVDDGFGGIATASVLITVAAVNDPPVADDQSVTTLQDTLIAIVLTASDVDGDALTFSTATLPGNGTLSGTAPDLTYTPNAGYFGTDLFTFTADDGTVLSPEATVSITVLDNSDVTPPSVPTNLATTAVTAGQIEFSWTASTDDVAVTGYRIFRDSVEIDTTTNPNYMDTNVNPATTYAYSVSAFDATGNESAQSEPLTAATSADITAPSVSITAPQDGATLSGVVNVTADATDDVGVEGVWFKIDGLNLGAEDTEFPWMVSWDTATILNGSYNLTAVARDATGNQTTSAPILVTVSNENTGIDYALLFRGNGVNDIDRIKIQIDDPANDDPGPPADVGAEDFTLEFWLRAIAAENTAAAVSCGSNVNWINGNIIIDRDRFNQDRKFGLSIAGGLMVFGVSGDGTGNRTICGSTNVLDDTWHHIAVQRRRSDGWMWLFVDGNLEAEFDGPDGDISYPDNGIPGNFCGPGGNQPCTNSDPYLVIGAEKHDAGSEFPSYSGWFDELRLSNSLRYSGSFAPPTAPFSPDVDTVALYNLNEGQGNTINDTSGALSGPSTGIANYGGNPPGPDWVGEAPFGPKVTLLTPTEGETVVGTTITINYQPFGNLTEVNHIHFQLDDGPERPDYDLDGFYQFTNISPGPHTIFAYLVRSNHLHITGVVDAEVTFVNIPDPSDPEPPTVSITAPQDGNTVSGIIEITADASDNVGVASVQFQVDGVDVGPEDVEAQYATSWNTENNTNDLHTITAIARDLAGNETTAGAITVNVSNEPSSPVQIGQWEGPFTWPIAPVHLALQPTGDIVMWDEETGGLAGRVWNPTLDTFTAVPNTETNLFCVGHSGLADGRTLVIGGHDNANFFGLPDTNIFDSATQSWTRVADMAFPRWYPTATTLQDGRVVAISGWINPSQLADVPEIYDPATDTWTALPNAAQTNPMYSFMFLLPDGTLFNAGPGVVTGSGSTMTYQLDIDNETWTPVSDSLITGHSAVMYEPGKIMKSGTLGDPDFSLPTVDGRTVTIDMNQANPNWQEVAPMALPRAYHNLVILPDGTVLAVGGERTAGGQNVNQAVFESELWDPQTSTWTTMDSQQRPRLYHSTALLLPDGRVLSAGGYFPLYVEENAEIYSPPYLFRGLRPTITSAPATAQYGSQFFVETSDASDVASVVLMRTGAVTHGFDQNQRRVPVTFTQSATGLNIQAPANGNLAPPGYYMIFLINTNGVPSLAEFIRIEAVATQPPTANDDSAATDEDISSVIDVLANDTDPDGDPLSVSSATQGANGTTTINGDNTVTYTPNPDFFGVDSFSYTASDGNGGSDTATVSVTVNPINDPPQAVDDSAVTQENAAVLIDVLANDSDPDGDGLTVSAVTQGANGTVTENGDGTATYTPNASYVGPDSFTYTAADGNGGSDTATVSVTMNPVNDPPVAGDQLVMTDEDAATAVTLTATDPDGDPLTFALDTSPTNGTLSGTPPNLTYTPDLDFNGFDNFIFSVDDGNGGTDTGTISLMIQAINDPPIADDQAIITDQNTPTALTLTGSDVDGDALTFNVVTPPTNGILSGTPPELTYTPSSDYTGPDSFTFVSNDGTVDSELATVSITVNPVAAGPALETGIVQGITNTDWTTISLARSYDSMVVVASPNYDATSVPLVTRIRNAAGNSFELRIDRADGSTAGISGIDVHYLVIEEAVYTQAADGVTMEAVKFVSTVTDRRGSWVGESRTYSNTYANPVVVGQVMTYNDPGFSVFWSRGNSRSAPPSSSQLWVGKTVAEDTDQTRLDETIGYLVIEAGNGTIGSRSYVAALGGDTVRGVTNNPPYSYAFSGLSNPSTAVISQAAMDGTNGGWALLYGPNPVSAGTLNVAVDEDQIRDIERSHTSEQVSYIVFEP